MTHLWLGKIIGSAFLGCQIKPIHRPEATTPIHNSNEREPASLAPRGEVVASSQRGFRREARWKNRAWAPARRMSTIFKRKTGLAYMWTASDEKSNAPVTT